MATRQEIETANKRLNDYFKSITPYLESVGKQVRSSSWVDPKLFKNSDLSVGATYLERLGLNFARPETINEQITSLSRKYQSFIDNQKRPTYFTGGGKPVAQSEKYKQDIQFLKGLTGTKITDTSSNTNVQPSTTATSTSRQTGLRPTSNLPTFFRGRASTNRKINF